MPFWSPLHISLLDSSNSPLIARDSAVVTYTGGVLAHTAIVAREFGIPCVVGTGNATSIIVDGGEGTVRGEK